MFLLGKALYKYKKKLYNSRFQIISEWLTRLFSTVI